MHTDKSSVIELQAIKMKVFKRLMFYPAILLFCYIPATIHRFYTELKINDNDVLEITAMFGNCIYGFCNSIAYGCTRHIRKRIKAKLFSHIVKKDSLIVDKESIMNSY